MGQSPLRVEQALRFLPDIDALAPLRAFLICRSRQPATEPHGTVGKRYLQAADFRELVPSAVTRVTEHLAALYEAAIEVLEAEQRGDPAAAVGVLLRAGTREERVGRRTQARAWYEHALRIAEELRDRRPEIEALEHLGRLEAGRARYEDAARFFQRSLALAEAELDNAGAARACQGLGDVAHVQEEWQGAASWYTRGLSFAETDRVLTGQLYRGLADAARGRGQIAIAEDWLSRARQVFEELGHRDGIVRTLNAWGLLDAVKERRAEAQQHFRDALARLSVGEANPELEMLIRLNLCRLYLDWGRLLEAEDEIRRAEDTAIAHNLTLELARLYVVMGKVRGLQRDETGFVFFEKAIELCRGADPAPQLEAEAYLEYGLFRRAFGEGDEARAYLERAREVLETTGNASILARADAEIASLNRR
jgi:tetratricopeptide (TPR) repeat protein